MIAPDYAAYLSVPILDSGRNAKRNGDRLLDHVQCACVDLIMIINIYYQYVSNDQTMILSLTDIF